MRAWTLRQRECSSLAFAATAFTAHRDPETRWLSKYRGAVFRQANPTCRGREPRCPRTAGMIAVGLKEEDQHQRSQKCAPRKKIDRPWHIIRGEYSELRLISRRFRAGAVGSEIARGLLAVGVNCQGGPFVSPEIPACVVQDPWGPRPAL